MEKSPRITGQKDVFILERANKPEEEIINPVSFAQKLRVQRSLGGSLNKKYGLEVKLLDNKGEVTAVHPTNVYVSLPNVNIAKSDYLEVSKAGSPSDWKEHQFDPKNLSLS